MSNIKNLFLECYKKCYKRFFKGYFGYEHSEKTKQDIEIGELTLLNLGLMESINELLEEAGKGSDDK